jgi:hypothetical protein
VKNTSTRTQVKKKDTAILWVMVSRLEFINVITYQKGCKISSERIAFHKCILYTKLLDVFVTHALYNISTAVLFLVSKSIWCCY